MKNEPKVLTQEFLNFVWAKAAHNLCAEISNKGSGAFAGRGLPSKDVDAVDDFVTGCLRKSFESWTRGEESQLATPYARAMLGEIRDILERDSDVWDELRTEVAARTGIDRAELKFSYWGDWE